MESIELKLKLKTMILELTELVIDEVAGGNINDKKIKDYSFYERMRYFQRVYKQATGETISAEEIFALCRTSYLSTISIGAKLTAQQEVEALADRYFAYKSKIGERVTIESLAQEIADFLNQGGDINPQNIKTVPMYERIRTFIKASNKEQKLTTTEVFKTALEYAKQNNLINTDQVVEYARFNDNALYAEFQSLKKLKKALVAIASEDGEIDLGKISTEHPRLYNRLKELSTENHLTILEYVAFFMGDEPSLFVNRGYIQTGYIKSVENKIAAFAANFGTDNLLDKIRRQDPKLFNQIRYLSQKFPEGSITPSQLMDFFGYPVRRITSFVAHVPEDVLVDSLRASYKLAIKQCVLEYGEIDMTKINRFMNLRGNQRVYKQLLKLAAANNCSIATYIRGKEIVPVDIITLPNGEKKQVPMTIGGKPVPALEYSVGLEELSLLKTMEENGQERTALLREKLEKLKEGKTFNSVEEEFLFTKKAAQKIIEEQIEFYGEPPMAQNDPDEHDE